ncbi:hypothetical protein ACROYT_G026715 [Oculina patagonica]
MKFWIKSSKRNLGVLRSKVGGKESSESPAGADDLEADKLKEQNVEGQETEALKPLEQTSQKNDFAKTIAEMRKILNDGMMKEIMEAASATQAEMERQFDGERAQMKSDVELIKTKIREIEETEEKNGVKDEQLGETMSKIKDSIDRFEETNLELDEDMQTIKELNKEIFSIIENKDNTDARGDLVQLSSKTNKLLKKILLRRFQLEQDLHYITKMRSKISDLDNTEAGTGAGAGTTAEDTPGIKPGSSTTAGVEDADATSESGVHDQGDRGPGVSVKVSKIKKVTIPDDDESDLEETDLDGEDMEELHIDKRIRQATKKMEEMVKEQLRDSGVLPSGKIRVKIVTSKDALESLDGKSDMKLLSEREETQFRDMILGLLGGSPDAGKERKRQQDLENNYNLVWNDDELQTVPREDDEADESKKKATEEAKAAKVRAQKARAAKRVESEDEIIEEERFETKKKTSKRSQVWPWESPGVESEDEVFIDGNIEQDHINVHRLDITKSRKKTADGYHESEGITVMSQKMHRKRELESQRQKGETEDTMKEISELEDEQEQTDKTETNEGDKDKEATEQKDEQEIKGKDTTSEEGAEEKDIESSKTPDGSVDKKSEKETIEADRGLDDEWKTKMEEAVLKLRSTLKEKLVKLGIKPEVLDQKFEEKLGSVAGKVGGKDGSESPAGADDQEADKLKEQNVEGQETEALKPLEQTSQKNDFAKTIAEMRKILNDGMMKEIMEAASATHAEMERQFDGERAQMKSDVELIKTKIREIEETEEKNGVKDEQLGETMSKIKDSIDRFEETNLELDEDMQTIKELNKEIFSIIENKDNTDARGDLVQLSSKTNKLLKKILLRRFQLEQDLHYITKMRSKISGGEVNAQATDSTEFGTTKGGIDQVVNKLKNMIQDLDNTEAGTGAGAGTTEGDTPGIKPGRSTTAGVEDSDATSESGVHDQGDRGPGVSVKVSKIKKVTIPDDDESDLEETDLDGEEMEELHIDKRIRQATKKMEEMVKEQLRDSGVLPSGKIRVKIVTSKDALESLDGKSDMKLLSEREETQFRDMILGLLGGSPDAGKERKRQQDLENNYNLVWNDDELQTVPREDDEADGEVQVESY